MDHIQSVIRRQVGRPCAFSRRDSGIDEFARVTWRIRRLDRQSLRLLAEEIDRLLADGFLCEICLNKIKIYAAIWLDARLPLRAAEYRRQVTAPSTLVAAGRDLEAEIEAALSHYPWPL